MPHITRHTGKERAIFIGTIMLTIATMLLPIITKLARVLQPHNWNSNPLLLIIVALIMGTAGLAIDFINLPALTSVQEMTPDWIKGRVLALQLVLYNACAIPIILFIGIMLGHLWPESCPLFTGNLRNRLWCVGHLLQA